MLCAFLMGPQIIIQTMKPSCWFLRPVDALCLCSEFVVAIMSDWFVESANYTCGSFPPDVDEMAAAGLTPVSSVHVAPPRVQESAISMECKVRQVLNGDM